MSSVSDNAERAARRRVGKRFVFVSGWLPPAQAAKVQKQIEAHREDVEAAARDAKPRGRPRKQPK